MQNSSIRLSICVVLLLKAALCAQEVEVTEASTEIATAGDAEDPAVEPEVEIAEHFALPAEHHVWGRFQPGAWRELRITTETFDEQGDRVSRNVTTQQEILKSVTPDSYALDVQATVDLVGKRVIGNWQTRVRHLATDGAGQIVESRRLGADDLTINGKPVACQQWELHYREDSQTRVDRIHYASDSFPFVLRRETLSFDEDTQQLQPFEKRTTLALSIPYTFQGELVSCSCVRSVRNGGKGGRVTIAMLNDNMPGGEVVVWSTETDAEGLRVRWSVLELVAFGISPRTLDSSSESSPSDTPAESPRRRRRLLRPNRSNR